MATRIRTTHVGSLPRPDAVARQLTAREDHGFATGADRATFDETIGAAVAEVVRRQVDIGIDLVSDGEMSKITYSTYVKDRLTGFDGDTPRLPALDLAPYGELRRRLTAAAGGAQSFKRQSCVGPIEYIGHTDLQADLAHLRAAVDAARLEPADAFMNAASPGLVTAFQGNDHFATHEQYVEAVGDAMRTEYEAIVAAGFTLQLDCPDLAMARHTGFQHMDEDAFLRRAAHHVDVLNHATRNIDPTSMRMHLCWGNYEGPHDHDIELDRILPIVLRARPSHILFEAANPRHAHEWTMFEKVKVPEGKILIPGVIECQSNYIEHPEVVAQRIGHYANLVGRDNVMAAVDCGFSIHVGTSLVDPDVVWAKLAALAQGAEIASKKFWGKPKAA